MSDRNLGYAVIFFLFIFLLVPAVYLSISFFRPVHHRTIVFEDVNTLSFLQIEDPVKVRGIDVGIVRSISWKNNKTYVKIETDRALELYRGYKVFAEDKGIMGDRYISIYPGKKEEPPVHKRELLQGVFLMGPTEAISRIRDLDALVDSVAALVIVLKQGAPDKKSFIIRFTHVMDQLDKAALALSSGLKKTNRILDGNIDTLSAFLKKTARFSESLSSTVPETVTAVETLFVKTELLLSKTDSLAVSSIAFLERINMTDTLSLYKELQNLRSGLSSIRSGIKELRKQGLKLPIKLR